MKKSPCGKGYTTCLCFLIECPNYLNQFCIVLIAALSCKKEFFLNTEIFYKISENYWRGNCPTCPTGSEAPESSYKLRFRSTSIRELLVLTFKVHGSHCVRFICLECQNKSRNKYFLVWTSSSVDKSILLYTELLKQSPPVA